MRKWTNSSVSWIKTVSVNHQIIVNYTIISRMPDYGWYIGLTFNSAWKDYEKTATKMGSFVEYLYFNKGEMTDWN